MNINSLSGKSDQNLIRSRFSLIFSKSSVSRRLQAFDWLSRPNDPTYQKDFDNSCEGLSKDAVFQIRAKSNKICGRSSVLSVFHKIQNGGKTTLAENDVIGCVGFVSAQGFHRYQVFENRTSGSKVTSRNVPPTLTCWWR